MTIVVAESSWNAHKQVPLIRALMRAPSRTAANRPYELAASSTPAVSHEPLRFTPQWHSSVTAARPAAAPVANVNVDIISAITDRERQITGEDGPAADGPTARAQRHVGKPLTQVVISDIIQGERALTGRSGPVPEGPAAMLQKMLDGGHYTSRLAEKAASSAGATKQQHSGKLDSATISSIADAEKAITGSSEPVKGGPAAQAQRHANEPIDSANLHDITEGEKKITGEARAVKGGPTAAAQSELGKSRSS
ncbi:hypothetical protein Micbo1qcDRAFT_175887 [Microdochium bolleyi]|uniref:SMP domain-containing protein n=1 Tax=Microdochium bolleyi TaxID=196109 RepID=A0A136J0Y3_9PEZI|nr:hypothetical protein Micbo1qcDRAFT_175887 [Microdochium bolleyi]